MRPASILVPCEQPASLPVLRGPAFFPSEKKLVCRAAAFGQEAVSLTGSDTVRAYVIAASQRALDLVSPPPLPPWPLSYNIPARPWSFGDGVVLHFWAGTDPEPKPLGFHQRRQNLVDVRRPLACRAPS